jgi:hypothetical protein
LDREILELTPDGELDHEVEMADEYSEKISLTIIEIDDSLQPPVPPPISPPAVPAYAHHRSISPSAPRVKLPKLTIKKFDGDLTKWVSFWDAFEASIHVNSQLTDIDKFNYLRSFLESAAYEAISGLTLTSANYSEAVDTLKRRFGNSQLIINKHMDALLALPSVTSHNDLKGLRHLYDSVESHVRGLRALGVSSDSYGSLLTSMLMNKLPGEIRLVIARELNDEHWEVDKLMEIIDKEVDARERSIGQQLMRKTPHKSLPTGAVLVTSNSRPTGCVYCGGDHQSDQCTVITEPQPRKETLRKAGRCYVCLRKYHTSRNCRSKSRCTHCNGRHHSTICLRSGDQSSQQSQISPTPPTNTMYIDSNTPILLQTAKLHLVNPSRDTSPSLTVRGVLDSGSQRTYITRRIKSRLHLSALSNESLHIKTFGASPGMETQCELVNLGVHVSNGEVIMLNALVVPFICNPITFQPISVSRERFDHLMGLELADSADAQESLEIDVLIGSDSYWSFVTGNIIRGICGPTAVQTKMGWVLSGPAGPPEISTNLIFNATHALTVSTSEADSSLDEQLKQFWTLESLGIMEDEPSVHETFLQHIKFNGERYQVSLPWKEAHPTLPTNYDLCLKRLNGVLRKLKNDPHLLNEYERIISDQLKKGIVEPVIETTPVEGKLIHYLPHHGVVRQDKATSKLRIVYDASAKVQGHPSLNDCLHTGPNFGQSIFDILLRFRVHQVILTGDIEKAFLMIAIEERDRDVLRFLWVDDAKKESPKIKLLRFARVVFGVSCSPFLLNATVNHHMEAYRNEDPLFVEKFQSSIYVDDVTLGSEDVMTTYELYIKSKLRLSQAGFKLRKFVSNSQELRRLVKLNEQSLEDEITDDGETHKILGIIWNFTHDSLLFDVDCVAHKMDALEPTKRNVVSLTAKFFDPLGIVSPVTVLFKIFFQELCVSGVNWDDTLTEEQLERWNQLKKSLGGPRTLIIPRLYFETPLSSLENPQLIGFCDASRRAYAAVVYVRAIVDGTIQVKFVAAKTRIAPLKEITIPRLELLAAVLLSKLIVNVRAALESELSLDNLICYSDSTVTLYWIYGHNREWKQFVENRTKTIRRLVPPHSWRHCPGECNPADIPSRGLTFTELLSSDLWLRGPDLLYTMEVHDDAVVGEMPEECAREVKKNVTLLLAEGSAIKQRIGLLMECKDFSSLHRLLRVTGLVIKFIRLISSKNSELKINSIPLGNTDIARLYWIQEAQIQLTQDPKFELWRRQFNVSLDEQQIWRCNTRMSNSRLISSAKNPALLHKKHPLIKLIVENAHIRTLHGGVKDTLTELRSAYWLIGGRQFTRQLIHRCVRCRRLEGMPYKGAVPPPLPAYRVQQSRPFQYTGVDFAGPMYVKSSMVSDKPKTWMCLYTCAVTRAVHLDLVPDLNTMTFLRCFKRFTSRRGVPKKIVSDNGKTFVSASSTLASIFNDPDVSNYFESLQIEWSFNLQRAPWWGGLFERLIRSTKRCLKKVLGKASVTYEELLTILAEAEAVLNSRPLTFISSEDSDEPLTPSHLMFGFRVLSLPEPTSSDEDPCFQTASDLNRRSKYLTRISDTFWRRWRKEYLLELRELHRFNKQGHGVDSPVKVGEVVTVFEENLPRSLWRLGVIDAVIGSADGQKRAARVRVLSKTGRPVILQRPIQHLYPLEVQSEDVPNIPALDPVSGPADSMSYSPPPAMTRPQRAAASEARDGIYGYSLD